ncbi:helix-turn-helix transcriptional regulator [Clostridium felsineum]|uniref:helix-turn-helix domain-containing protein n=1 Tax=Clostridium felsineum TaxID=36839 RepID=UPI00358DA938|nr:helix-turn-helix transcriptional regulator [Clostridium felsineum]
MIKEYRKLKGMTQRELAKKARLKQSYISELERGNYNKYKSPTMRTVSRLAKALDVCPHLLVRYNIECDYDCINACSKNLFE